MNTVGDFVPLVIARSVLAEDAHETVLQELIRSTVITFMRESQSATDEYYFKPQCGVEDYQLDIPKCHNVVTIAKVTTGPDNQVSDRSWSVIRTKGDSRYGWSAEIQSSPAVIYLDTHTLGEVVCVKYSYSIGRDGCEIPEYIYQDYADTIVAGVIARLVSREGGNGSTYQFEFEQGVQAARTRTLREYNQGSRYAKAKPFLGRPR